MPKHFTRCRRLATLIFLATLAFTHSVSCQPRSIGRPHVVPARDRIAFVVPSTLLQLTSHEIRWSVYCPALRSPPEALKIEISLDGIPIYRNEIQCVDDTPSIREFETTRLLPKMYNLKVVNLSTGERVEKTLDSKLTKMVEIRLVPSLDLYITNAVIDYL